MIMMALGRGKRILLGILLVLVAGGALLWRIFRVSDLLLLGTGYTAQQTCACLHTQKRTLDSCLTDLEPLARRLIRIRPAPDSVTATGLLGLWHATAHHDPTYGCTLTD